MNDAFYIAATGMQAQQKNLNTISNNLTNVNTSGFKKSRVVFSDLMIDASKKTSSNELDATDTSNQSGSGVSASNMLRSFESGELKTTGSPFDVAIQGNGFIEVAMADGTNAFTRGGTLKVNEDGKLATSSGYVLKSNIQIPENTQSVSIDKDGKVSVQTTNNSKPVELGYIEIARFPNQNALAYTYILKFKIEIMISNIKKIIFRGVNCCGYRFS